MRGMASAGWLRTVAVAGLGLAVLSSIGRAAPAGAPVSSPDRPGSATERHWTPARLRSAVPMPLPKGGARRAEPLRPAIEDQADEPSADSPAAPPALDLAPDFSARLFDEPPPAPRRDAAPARALRPEAASASGALFTNSRVFPQAALGAYPYRTVGKLFFVDPRRSDDFVCSAAVIARRLVLTAGHCVYNAAERYWYERFVFVPALDGSRDPFGVWSARWRWTTQSWVRGGGTFPNPADFAILELRDRQIDGATLAIGDVVGRLGWRTEAVQRAHVTILGYPANLDDGLRMEQTQAESFDLDGPYGVLFGSYQGSGSSGGPFVLNFGRRAEGDPRIARNRVVGVMSYGLASDPFLSGTSILNGEFETLYDKACARRVDNC